MKKLLSLFTFMLFATVLLNSCRNPAYEMNVLFDADVIKYKATLILKGAAGETLPANITVEAAGQDAASIYDFSGTKKIYAPAGVITLGVTPKDIPTASKTLAFNVKITAPGYEDKNIEMTIAENQFSQVIEVTMLKTVLPTEASVVKIVEAALSPTGATTAPISIVTPVNGDVEQSTSITVPTGTQFKDAAGNVIVGSAVTAQAINFDPSDPLSVELFPAGSLSSSNVVLPNGQTGEAFFLPAGFTDIQMFVGGVEVKNFTNPISISIGLDPDFRPQATGLPLAVGDKLGIYAYRTEVGQFTYEGEGTVALVNGKLTVTFSTNHLTVFIVGDVVVKPASCLDPSLTFSAPWMTNGATEPMTLEIYDTSDKLLATGPTIVSNGKVEVLTGLPSFAVKFKLINNAGKVLASGNITDPCAGGNINVTVDNPGSNVQSISLILNVKCPNKGFIIVPNFDLFYKPAGAPASAYTLLGTTSQGVLRTTLLTIGASYDFRATWNNQIKEVKGRTITSADMSTVVGENDFLGDKSPAFNKSLLIEACKGF
ncbi:hypothetical protein [Pedobacter sp. GR22-6]|uniref:hypothetical protein n=1 Tax=Pedobacter sp. GR22-6 TaxID=3127957 RepID=UPI00307CFAD5